MGAPNYQTDLSTVDLAEATTNWDESTDGNWDDGVPQTLSIETDYYIQGAGCMSSTMTKRSSSGSSLIPPKTRTS